MVSILSFSKATKYMNMAVDKSFYKARQKTNHKINPYENERLISITCSFM